MKVVRLCRGGMRAREAGAAGLVVQAGHGESKKGHQGSHTPPMEMVTEPEPKL